MSSCRFNTSAHLPILARAILIATLFLALLNPASSKERKTELAALLTEGAVVYYGHEPLDKTKFTDAKVVILEPSHWSTRSIRKLREQGKIVLGYLSVGELISTTRTRKNYRFLSENEDWNSLRVDPSDPAWRKTVIRRTKLAKQRELDGLMLDTVDITVKHPEAIESMAELVRAVHTEMPDRFLMMNRGFSVLAEVSREIDGVLFENANNRGFSANDRSWVNAQCERLLQVNMPVLILDYAESCDPEDSARMAGKYQWSYYVAPNATLAKSLEE